MPEKRLGIVPNAFAERGGLEKCVILITDMRTIIAFRKPEGTLKGALKQVYGFGSSPDQLPADLESADLGALAQMKGNISVPHSSIQKFSCGKGIVGFGLWIVYLDDEGKKRAVIANFEPTPEMIAEGKANGIKPKEIRRQFAATIQEIFKRALPPILSQEAEWKL